MDYGQLTVLNGEYPETKTRILEFINSIDDRENEILFSNGGFFSLNAKQAEEKFKEYCDEAEKFADKLINELKLNSETLREILIRIKNKKIEFLKNEMQTYISNEKKNYETETKEKTVNLTITSAVLRKNNQETVETAKQNGLSFVRLLNADKGERGISAALAEYKSNFVSAIIKSFLDEKDINAFYYFEKYKDELFEKEKTTLETAVSELKVNLIAYNFAKELFSYDLSEKDRDKEINAIKDEKIEKAVRIYLSDFERDKKKFSDEEEKTKNKENTDKIVSMLEENIDNAYLHIDYSLPENTVKFKKEYIKSIKKNGVIKTDSEKFLELISLLFSDFDEFIEKDISEYIVCLSKNDFSLFREFQSLEYEEYIILKSDFDYIFRLFVENNIEDNDIKREICLLYLYLIKKHKKTDGKSFDITVGNKIISEILTRYVK